MEPYVFVLDLDGTIIGDCSYQCDLYNLQDIFKQNIKSFNKSTARLHLINPKKNVKKN